MSIEAGSTITIPSPIDVHAHLREPGGEDKETIYTGTTAALHGGYQAVFDMPNNPGRPTVTEERVQEKEEIAANSANTNIGFYAGVNLLDPDLDALRRMHGRVAGIKFYMGHTTGNTTEVDLEVARPVIDFWSELNVKEGATSPILLHAREEVGAESAEYIAKEKAQKVHWCHLSTADEAIYLANLRKDYPELVFGGVTPHHLTMTSRDADFKYGWNGARMMPPLAEEADAEALLRFYNRGDINILETDHAPHTEDDKIRAETQNPQGHDGVEDATCFGVSGIEFVLPVMMSLVARRKIELERLIDSLHAQPAKLLGLIATEGYSETTLSINPYVLEEEHIKGSSLNTPYVNWTAWAKVIEVVVGNRTRMKNGRIYRSNFKPAVLKERSQA